MVGQLNGNLYAYDCNVSRVGKGKDRVEGNFANYEIDGARETAKREEIGKEGMWRPEEKWWKGEREEEIGERKWRKGEMKNNRRGGSGCKLTDKLGLG